MENATTFGAQASTYAAARPNYPDELFDWITSQSPTTQLAWDVGTGSGQAALSLAKRFSKIHASDIDSAQINHASPHTNIQYSQNPAHKSGLRPNTADAITVATALHWFDHGLFWQEVRRVAKPEAVFCAWTYHRAEADSEIQNTFLDPILSILAPYWSDGNRLSWRGYTKEELQMPFEVLQPPNFTCKLHWTPTQIAAFARSWSAHKKARADGHSETLLNLERKALEKFDDSPRPFTLPLNILAARID